MQEVQRHGFSFEAWVRENLFAGYSGEYGQKWDIPAENNQHNVLPDEIENLPVSVKTAKFGSSIALGDAIRQRSISEPFLIIAGFWRQRTPEEKWFEDIACVLFKPEPWNSLWGPVKLEDLQQLDTLVKNQENPPEEARLLARAWKKRIAERGPATMVINPKIGSSGQRRVQCSLPFSGFWKVAGREPRIRDAPELFGVAFRNPIKSGSRVFED
jgi:hypothetical protein